ncbi:DUF6177 family protein [Cellulomonas dongxiuzhuiae]|uniref:DUF6177 family protein n=1 Tax=Cellulomonas dongxiuzhuiae TaxID=2819979 RepID=UPI001AAEB7B9|nr:DUF6177 family protein [Cellulomonas dongxiuzhuiae]MBO3089847.1 hypothetical protein [Cellulomonas dongxiuzhuiae]
MHVVHPVADEWTDRYVLWAARTRRVLLTAPLATFLDVAATDGLRPVLVTNGDAALSPLVSLALRRVGGHWAVRTERGVFDGLSGYRIAEFEDLWQRSGTDRERLPGYDRPTPDGVGVLMFDVYAHARAVETTVVGELAQALVGGLGGAPLGAWGPHEPLLEPWDLPTVTAAARAGMPATAALHGLGEGTFVDVTAARTRHGVLEQAKGGVVLGAYPREIAAPVERASDALTVVAERFRPTIGFVSLAHFDVDAGAEPVQRPTAKALEVPLAVVIGPRGVHDLQLDLEGLIERHDVSILGPTRTPSVVVRFSDPDVGLWAQLLAFAYDVGPQRIASAVGMDEEV